jgi:hypothetical protein
MINASEVAIRAVFDKLPEPADVVKKRYRLSYAVLIICQAELPDKIPHLFSSP